MVKWETEQATVKLLDDVSSGEIEEEETEEPECDDNLCDETKSILEANSIAASKSINKLSNECVTSDKTEQTSEIENESEQIESDSKEC